MTVTLSDDDPRGVNRVNDDRITLQKAESVSDRIKSPFFRATASNVALIVTMKRKYKSLGAMVIILVLATSVNLHSLHFHSGDEEALLELDHPSSPFKTQTFLFDSSSQSLRGVNIKDLNAKWNSKSAYDDLLKLSGGSSSAVHPNQALLLQQQDSYNATNTNNRVILLWHAVPKTAGTTVRKAIFKHIAKTCPNSGEAATQQGAFRDVDSLHQLMTDCHDTHDYGLGGRMTFRPLSPDSNVSVIHTLAFRPYKEWALSALNQIVKVGGSEQCDIVRGLLKSCQDYRELSFNQYTKSQLKRIRRYSLSPGRDIVILYNYRDTDLFHSQIRTLLQLPPLKLEAFNTNRTNEKCPDDVLESFYNCHEL